MYDAKPCPFCQAEIRHIESVARSFDPNRTYHEWHHPRNDCFIAERFSCSLLNADEKPESTLRALAKWNART